IGPGIGWRPALRLSWSRPLGTCDFSWVCSPIRNNNLFSYALNWHVVVAAFTFSQLNCRGKVTKYIEEFFGSLDRRCHGYVGRGVLLLNYTGSGMVWLWHRDRCSNNRWSFTRGPLPDFTDRSLVCSERTKIAPLSPECHPVPVRVWEREVVCPYPEIGPG